MASPPIGVQRAMAKAYFPGASPLGRSFSIASATPDSAWSNLEGMGVAKNAQYKSLREPSGPAARDPHS